jgi:branched-chain amino acid transport system substrate-binding protein
MKIMITSLFKFFFVVIILNVNSQLQAEEVKIVSSLPRTGSASSQTTSIVNGIKLALKEIDNKVLGQTIIYEDWDDASPEKGSWDPAVEATNAERAIKDKNILAYIGTYNSGAAKIAMPKLNQAGLLMISPAASWPGLTKSGLGEVNEPAIYRPSGRVTFFRVVPADDIQGYVAAKWANEMKLQKVFILHDRELYGKGIAEMFKKSSKEFNLEIVGFEGIDSKATNYKSLVTKIRQKSPDLIYFGGTTQTNAGQIAKDIVQSGLPSKMMFPDGCFENAFISSAGKEVLEGRTFITFGGLPAKELTGKGKDFFEAYKNTYKIEPEAYAAYGYEATKVLIQAIRLAGQVNRESVIRAMSEIRDFDGALGKWSFDQNGDTTSKTMSGNTVKNGAFEFVKILGE